MELLEKKGFEREKFEEVVGVVSETNYPESLHRFRLVHESPTEDVEKTYFWFLEYISTELSMGNITKIVDVFSASEQSSAFGASQQRLAYQQQQAAQYLGTIAQMIKSMLQIVNELRKHEERLDYYEISYGNKKGDKHSAEIALKSIYVDMVEGGVQNAASVIGLSDKPGFKILPDLFFRVNLEEINSLTIGNEKTKEMLRRKLFQYKTWKENTYKELKAGKDMKVKYLRQHYSSIKIYMSWVKPYLQNIRKLSMSRKKMDSPSLISAFEGTMFEIEILARKPDKAGEDTKNKVHPCMLLNFDYTTKPLPIYPQEQQRGNRFVGRIEVNIRAYAWTNEQIKKYQELRDEEDMKLIGEIGGILTDSGMIDPTLSLSQTMDSMGEDLKKYLEEAGEEFEKKEEEEEKEDEKKKVQGSVLDPFIEVAFGFRELFTAFVGNKKKNKKKEEVKISENDFKAAKKEATGKAGTTYRIFKKAHGMLAWKTEYPRS